MRELFPNKADLPVDAATPVHFIAGLAAGSIGLGPLMSILVIQGAKLGYVLIRSGKDGLYDAVDGPLKHSVDTLCQGVGSVIGGAIRTKISGKQPLIADVRNVSGLGLSPRRGSYGPPRVASPSRAPSSAPSPGVMIGEPMDEM